MVLIFSDLVSLPPDLLVGLVNVLTDLIWKFTVEWYAGNFMCKLVRFMQVGPLFDLVLDNDLQTPRPPPSLPS